MTYEPAPSYLRYEYDTLAFGLGADGRCYVDWPHDDHETVDGRCPGRGLE